MSRGAEGHAGTEGVVEPITGATMTNVEALAMGIPGLWVDALKEAQSIIAGIAEHGYVIAPAADVITTDQRARLRHLIRYFDGYKAPEQIGIAAWEIRDTLVALATGGTDGQ